MTHWEDELATAAEESTPIYDQLRREQRDAMWARLGFREVVRGKFHVR